MTLATKALETLFGVTGKGMIDRISVEQDGDQKDFWNVQHIILNMNHQANKANKRCKTLDLMDICVIAGLRLSTSSDRKKWFDDSKINLWTDYIQEAYQAASCVLAEYRKH